MTATAFRISHCKLDRVKNKALRNPTDDKLRAIALAYPGAIEDHPWGHSAFKVNKKVFLFLGSDEEGVGLSVKLPRSGANGVAVSFRKGDWLRSGQERMGELQVRSPGEGASEHAERVDRRELSRDRSQEADRTAYSESRLRQALRGRARDS
jgi:hypothetical protein